MTIVKVDDDLCIGCRACVSACPEGFELNEEGKSVWIGTEGITCDLDEVALDCPVQAITVTNEQE